LGATFIFRNAAGKKGILNVTQVAANNTWVRFDVKMVK
jgi:hypothetical protein